MTITTEAITAAAGVLSADPGDIDARTWARAVLEAAEPHMAAGVDSRVATARALGTLAERDSLRLDLPPQVVTLHDHKGERVQAVLRCGLLYLNGETA